VTDLDLDAIRARYDTWGGVAADIPALLTEVERLQAQHAAALALCDQAERHAGTARFGYLNEDDVRRALGVNEPAATTDTR